MSTLNAIDHRLAYWQNYKYYEGHLFVKVQRVGYEKRWMVLLGNEIHIYTTKIPQRDQGSAKPIQHYPLHPSISITIDSDFKMHIKCELWTIRAQATSNEERENWRIRIHTIARGETPDQGRLLPGQQELLADILQKETVRKLNPGKPVGPPRRGSLPGLHLPPHQPSPGRRRVSSFNDGQGQVTDNSYYKFLPEDIAYSQMLPPVWFFGKISRAKAEEILHLSTSHGDLLLRESEAHPGQYTLSVRQDTDNKSLIRHYMFKKNPFGFTLLIEDKPPVLASMYELMWFFIQESGGHLLPIQKDPNLPSTIYDIRFPSAQYKDPANGETSSKPDRGMMRKSASLDDNTMSRNSVLEEEENDYLVPDIVSPRGRHPSSTINRSPLMSVSESFDAPDDTYSPADDDVPLREAPRPPQLAGQHHPYSTNPNPSPSPSHHHRRSDVPLPSPPGDSLNLTTGYVKMKSFHSAPALHQVRRHDDVGYINMKKQSSLDEGSHGDGARGDGKSLTPPPLPRKSRSHHGYCTHLKSVPEELAEAGFTSPVVQHLKCSSLPRDSDV
ncbi:uncharacterized protein LOC581450 isoform X3 [Strongylocentrotus purpuratus]|uniref:SH2 domain-containing protein n=1 Tax=Strongylocentrotus purpuratus TaxID=7668 RepID=A0A7M7NCL6_STRPU|nr:uncharacterized protein LOC581450 isoform X3 [Strongylocentrotus purpuratus]